jgi:predicted PurR-regulated permease PerM
MNKTRTQPRSSSVRTAGILVAVIAVLYLAREILIPLAFAITLALIVSPAVVWLTKLRLSRAPAVIVVMLISIAAVAGISFVIFNQLVEVANELPRYQENIHNKIVALRTHGKGSIGRAADSVKEIGKELSTAPPAAAPSTSRRAPQNPAAHPLPVQVVEDPPTEFQYVRDLARQFLKPLGILGIVLIFTVFLLIEQDDLRNRIFRLAGLNHLNLMTQALDDATQRVSRYLALQLLVNVGFGALCGIGLYLIGVPYAALWGTVAALLRIVPYVGALVAGLLPLVLSLAVFDQWLPPVLVFVLFATVEIVTGNFVEPWLYGSHTGISALALLLTTVFWAALWGPAGLILSTPLTVCVVVLGRHIPQLSFLHILLGDRPALEAEAQIYQRLLAMDDNEARAVADRYLAEHSLVELYDLVIIPAITLAEQDRHKGALDASREEFFFLSVKEMLAEFSERATATEPSQTVTSIARVFCLPASDEADEIAASMLAQLLEQSGCTAMSFPLDPSIEHTLGLLEPAKNDMIVISSLPPFAFARARTISVRLQRRFPATKILIGVWGFSGDPARALQRFQSSRPHALVTSFANAMSLIVEPEPVAQEQTQNVG